MMGGITIQIERDDKYIYVKSEDLKIVGYGKLSGKRFQILEKYWKI